MIELDKEVNVNDVEDDEDGPPDAWEEMIPHSHETELLVRAK